MRKTMVEAVSKMIDTEKDSSLFLVDIGVWAFRDVLKNNPDRAYNIGIFEDGLISVAAGMALRGLNPTIYGITPFIIDRALEQLKLDFGYQKLRGNFITTGASYDFSIAGYSHYCPEDVQVLKTLPGFQILAPGNAKEFKILFDETHNNEYPTYFRMSDYTNKIEIDIEFGQAIVIKTGSKATVVAVSTMLDVVVDACKDMDVNIVYYTTLQPFDYTTLREADHSGKILLCEPFYEGTLINDVMTSLKGRKIQIETVGVKREIIRKYGTKPEKDAAFGFTAENIKNTLTRLIEE